MNMTAFDRALFQMNVVQMYGTRVGSIMTLFPGQEAFHSLNLQPVEGSRGGILNDHKHLS